MIGYEIEAIIKAKGDWRVKSLFRGVYSADNLPKHLPLGQGHGLICNLSATTQPGTHWIAIFISPFGDLTYFDSFGRECDVASINRFINVHARTLTYNKIPVQGSMSRTCGLFCIHFIMKRCEGFDLRRILATFHPFRPELNDRLVLSQYLHKYTQV